VTVPPARASQPAEAEEWLRLVRRLTENLDEGFLEFVRAYERPVYSFVLRLSGKPFDAEDLAAETFLRAYRALRGYDAAQIHNLQLRAWLMTIALNVWRNAQRSGARRAEEVPLELAADTPSGPDEADRVAERSDRLRQLGQLVSVLSEQQRIAVVLRYICDLSIAEVAQVIGCPEGTARSHISRGLQRLRAEAANLNGATPPAINHHPVRRVTPQPRHRVPRGGTARVRDPS
jgi:RNA polymerase sigma-70 factor, ECF subfamily